MAETNDNDEWEDGRGIDVGGSSSKWERVSRKKKKGGIPCGVECETIPDNVELEVWAADDIIHSFKCGVCKVILVNEYSMVTHINKNHKQNSELAAKYNCAIKKCSHCKLVYSYWARKKHLKGKCVKNKQVKQPKLGKQNRETDATVDDKSTKTKWKPQRTRGRPQTKWQKKRNKRIMPDENIRLFTVNETEQVQNMELIQRFACDFCDRTYSSIERVTTHTNRRHAQQQQEEFTFLKESWTGDITEYRSDQQYCYDPNQFGLAINDGDAESTMSGDSMDDMYAAEWAKTKSAKLACATCQESFPSAASLVKHTNSIHHGELIDDGVERGIVKCSNCNKAHMDIFSKWHRGQHCITSKMSERNNRWMFLNNNDSLLGDAEDINVFPAVLDDETFDDKSMVFFQELMLSFTYGLTNLHWKHTESLAKITTKLLSGVNEHAAERSTLKFFSAVMILPGLVKKLQMNGANLTAVLSDFLRAEKPEVEILKKAVKEKGEKHRPKSFEKSIEKKIMEAEKAIRYGDLSKAMNIMKGIDEEFVEPMGISDQCDEFKRLNPVANDDDVLPQVPNDVEPIQLTLEEVIAGIQTRKKTTFAISGLSDRILKQLCKKDDGLAIELTAFFNTTLRGELCEEITYLWTMCRALLIPKSNIDKILKWRPICIGDCLYRLMASITARKLAPLVTDELAPIQLAIGLKGGAEIGAIMARILSDVEGNGLLIFDIENAFNSVRKILVWKGLERYLPQALPLFKSLYGNSCELRNGFGELLCQNFTGVRQGDPLSLLLFCIALIDIFKQVRFEVQRISGNCNSATSGYADDLFASVPLAKMKETDEAVTKVFVDAGFRITVKWAVKGDTLNTKVLGNPLGSDLNVAIALADKMEKWRRSIKYFHKLRPLSAYKLLSFCVNAQPQYLARVMAWDVVKSTLIEFDNMVDAGLASILNLETLPMDMSFKRGLPQNLSGINMYKLGKHYGRKWNTEARIRCKEFLGKHSSLEWLSLEMESNWDKLDVERLADGDVLMEFTNCYTDFESGSKIFLDIPSGIKQTRSVDIKPSKMDHTITQIDRKIWGRLFAGCILDKNLHDAANMRGFAYDGSASWIPKLYGLNNTQFVDILKYRLGGRIYGDDAEFRCTMESCRQKPFLINQSTHAFDCNQNKGGATIKHNAVVQLLVSAIRPTLPADAEIFTKAEDCRRFYPTTNGDKEIIPDALWTGTVGGTEREFWLDVSISNPGCPSNVAKGGPKSSVMQQGVAAEHSYLRKLRHYEKMNSTRGEDDKAVIVPFVMESTGFVHDDARAFLAKQVGDDDHSNRIIASTLTNLRAAMMLYQARQFENLRGGRSQRTNDLRNRLGTQQIIDSFDEDNIISQNTTQQTENSIINSQLDELSQPGTQLLSDEDTAAAGVMEIDEVDDSVAPEIVAPPLETPLLRRSMRRARRPSKLEDSAG